MISAERVETVWVKFQALRQEMDERTRRLWAASEARALGYGGISAAEAVRCVATLMLSTSDTPPFAAVISADPTPTAVMTPLAPTAATLGSLDEYVVPVEAAVTSRVPAAA